MRTNLKTRNQIAAHGDFIPRRAQAMAMRCELTAPPQTWLGKLNSMKLWSTRNEFFSQKFLPIKVREALEVSIYSSVSASSLLSLILLFFASFVSLNFLMLSCLNFDFYFCFNFPVCFWRRCISLFGFLFFLLRIFP